MVQKENLQESLSCLSQSLTAVSTSYSLFLLQSPPRFSALGRGFLAQAPLPTIRL